MQELFFSYQRKGGSIKSQVDQLSLYVRIRIQGQKFSGDVIQGYRSIIQTPLTFLEKSTQQWVSIVSLDHKQTKICLLNCFKYNHASVTFLRCFLLFPFQCKSLCPYGPTGQAIYIFSFRACLYAFQLPAVSLFFK